MPDYSIIVIVIVLWHVTILTIPQFAIIITCHMIVFITVHLNPISASFTFDVGVCNNHLPICEKGDDFQAVYEHIEFAQRNVPRHDSAQQMSVMKNFEGIASALRREHF